MEILITLTLAHLLADFPLQTNAIATAKNKSFQILCSHVLIHMVVLWLLFGLRWSALPLVLGVGLSHLLVDRSKQSLPFTNPVNAFLCDQTLHALCLLLASWLATRFYSLHLPTVLSPTLLYSSLIVSYTLAAMVLYWVWTTSLHDELVKTHHHLRWCREQLLHLEQRVGFGYLFILCLWVTLRSGVMP